MDLFFDFIQVLCYGWTLPQGLFVFFKNIVLYVWAYASPVLRVDAPAGAFSFLQKHRLIFLSVCKSCVTGGRSRRGFFFWKNTLYFWVYTSPVLRADAPAGAFFFWKNTFLFVACPFVVKFVLVCFYVLCCYSFLFTPSYIVECIQVLCYGWTLPQKLFVFFKNTFI